MVVMCSITPFDLSTFSVHRGIYLNRNIVQYLQDHFQPPQLFQS